MNKQFGGYLSLEKSLSSSINTPGVTQLAVLEPLTRFQNIKIHETVELKDIELEGDRIHR